MAIPKPLSGMDIEAALERLSASEPLWREALALFVERYRGWDEKWRQLSGDPFEERQSLHTLRSAAANIGANKLAELAGDMEAELCAGRGDEALRWQVRACFREVWRWAEDVCLGAGADQS